MGFFEVASMHNEGACGASAGSTDAQGESAACLLIAYALALSISLDNIDDRILFGKTLHSPRMQQQLASRPNKGGAALTTQRVHSATRRNLSTRQKEERVSETRARSVGVGIHSRSRKLPSRLRSSPLRSSPSSIRPTPQATQS